ncbi:MAG TPA: DUF4214 domain-containing protein, partial [Quisquiliibacterium sp.]|nr:DUF4214 domain-containing protein [Quisquiliibacterium sp.]
LPAARACDPRPQSVPTPAPSMPAPADAAFTVNYTTAQGNASFTNNTGKAYRLYQAAFARTTDLEGVGYWVSLLDAGAKLFDVATGLLGSAEFQAAYGVNPSNETYVAALYQNVLGRPPDQAGYDYWNSVLNPGYSRSRCSARAPFAAVWEMPRSNVTKRPEFATARHSR